MSGTKYEYILNGSTVMGQRWLDASSNECLLLYVYDDRGLPIAVQYRDREYAAGDFHTFFLEKDMLGNVIGVYNEDGIEIGTYAYDAWGNMTVTLASGITSLESNIVQRYNPFRYRSYLYDSETNLYYLQSRYYSPELGRFISADAAEVITATPMGLTDKNLFAYCDNNPVMRVDDGGYFWETLFDVVSLVVSVIDVAQNPDDPWAWAGLAADVVCLAVPFVTGGGAIVKAVSKTDDVVDAVKTVNKVDNAVDTANTVQKIHGNSLKTTKETIGYALRKNDTGEIMKFGETTRGTKRYTQKFYMENGVYMDPMARGSKYDMHLWQHNKIVEYTQRNGVRPPWNKSNW